MQDQALIHLLLTRLGNDIANRGTFHTIPCLECYITCSKSKHNDTPTVIFGMHILMSHCFSKRIFAGIGNHIYNNDLIPVFFLFVCSFYNLVNLVYFKKKG